MVVYGFCFSLLKNVVVNVYVIVESFVVKIGGVIFYNSVVVIFNEWVIK